MHLGYEFDRKEIELHDKRLQLLRGNTSERIEDEFEVREEAQHTNDTSTGESEEISNTEYYSEDDESGLMLFSFLSLHDNEDAEQDFSLNGFDEPLHNDDQTDESIPLKIKLSSKLLEVLKEILQPSEETVQLQASIYCESFSSFECVEIIETLPTIDMKRCFAKHMLIEAITRGGSHVYQILEKTLELYGGGKEAFLFNRILELLSTKQKRVEHLYSLAFLITSTSDSPLIEKFIEPFARFLTTHVGKTIVAEDNKSLITLSAFVDIYKNPEFLRFFFEKKYLKSYSEHMIFKHQQIISILRDYYIETLKAYSLEINITYSHLKEIEKHIEEAVAIQKNKFELVAEMYEPILSLTAHILKGEYGVYVKNKCLQGSYSKKFERAFIRLLLIHIVRKEIKIPSFVQPTSDMINYIKEYTSEQIENMFRVLQEDCLDDVIDSILKKIASIESKVDEFNVRMSLFAKENAELHLSQISKRTVAGSSKTETLLRDLGLWVDPFIFKPFLRDVFSNYVLSHENILNQLASFSQFMGDEEFISYLLDLQSKSLRAKYLSAFFYEIICHKSKDEMSPLFSLYLDLMPAEDILDSLEEIAQIILTREDEVGEKVEDTISDKDFEKLIEEGGDECQIDFKNLQPWFSKVEIVIGFIALVFKKVPDLRDNSTALSSIVNRLVQRGHLQEALYTCSLIDQMR